LRVSDQPTTKGIVPGADPFRPCAGFNFEAEIYLEDADLFDHRPNATIQELGCKNSEF